jgi:cyclopropane fatty-acyl-phospholipid synthase-like methyltransferase
MARKKFGTKKNGVHFEARQRREWIENYFSKGGEPLTTTEFHHKIKEAGFNCTKAALWNMLYNTSGLRCDKNTRKWALYGFSNKVARELESQLNQIVGA